LQTILGSQLPRRVSALLATQESIPVQVDEGTRIRLDVNRATHANAPVLIVVHGLGGSSLRGYMTGTANKAWGKGMNVVRMNMRNAGGTESWTNTLYHAGLTEDLEATVRWVEQEFPESSIVLSGFSLGGSVTLNTLAKWGTALPSKLKGAVVVSVPFDLHACDRSLHRGGINGVYVRYFMRSFRTMWKRKSAVFPLEFPGKGLDTVKSVRQFDERWTAPSFGFGTADNYYDSVSPIKLLPQIHCPGLVVHAEDDPFVPLTSDDRAAIMAHPTLQLLLAERGGHVGFLGRRPQPNSDGWQDQDGWWAENRIVQAALRFAAQ